MIGIARIRINFMHRKEQFLKIPQVLNPPTMILKNPITKNEFIAVDPFYARTNIARGTWLERVAKVKLIRVQITWDFAA